MDTAYIPLYLHEMWFPYYMYQFLLVVTFFFFKMLDSERWWKKAGISLMLNKQNTIFDLGFGEEKEKSKQDFPLRHCRLDKTDDWF